MNTSETTTPTPATTVPPLRAFLTLAQLATRSLTELDALYRGATVSSTMHAVDGALRGRMLAVRALPGALAAPLGRFAGSAEFPWEGKTFLASSSQNGVGHNRVHIPHALGRQNLFPFETHFGASAIDGQPALILDYDLAVNPSYIRHIHDEIREVSPGLYLGIVFLSKKKTINFALRANGSKSSSRWRRAKAKLDTILGHGNR